MTKPAVTLRTVKGTALDYAELDANFTNLKDATVSLQADTGGTTVTSDLNGTITLVAGSNVTITGDNTAKTITIESSGGGGGSSLLDSSGDIPLFTLTDTNAVVIGAASTVGGAPWEANIESSPGFNLNITADYDLNLTGDNVYITANSSGIIVLEQPSGGAVVARRTETTGTNHNIEVLQKHRTDTTFTSLNGQGIGLGYSLKDSSDTAKTFARVMGTYSTTSNGHSFKFDVSEDNFSTSLRFLSVENDRVVIGPTSGSDAQTVTTGATQDLVLSTNRGTDSGTITITDGVDGDITVSCDGTGRIVLDAPLKIAATTGTPTTYENGYFEDMLQTPVSWLKIDIGGSYYYIPLFQ